MSRTDKPNQTADPPELKHMSGQFILGYRQGRADAKTEIEVSIFDEAMAKRSLEHHDAWVKLINQAEDALLAMWNHFGDLSDNDMLGMPCKDALVKCREAIAVIKRSKEGR